MPSWRSHRLGHPWPVGFLVHVMNSELHDVEIKVWVTEQDADLLRAMARRSGLKLSPLVRSMIRKQLNRFRLHEETVADTKA